jgi:hypothetical protein
MSDALGPGSPVKIGLAIAAQLSLAACASFSPDGGMSIVQETAAVELGKDVVKETSAFEAALVGDRVRELLGRSLTADAAVQIALLNNQGLQASYNELGISEAQYVQASLPPNPTVFLQKTVAPNSLGFTEAVTGNLFALVTLPARRDIAETQFQAAQLRAIEATLRLTADVRRQYWRAVAAQELVRFLNEARGSAELLEDRGERAGRWVGMVFLDLALWPHMTGLSFSRTRPLP